MLKNEATLRINIFKRGNPCCSLCGQEFGSEGFANSLIEAFALHVRQRHMQAEMNRNVVRGYESPTTARIARAQQR
jgi:tRNA(Ile2) C34 agmatinyltransferase TiaS